MPIPAALAFNPALRAATQALKPLAKNISGAVPKFGDMIRRLTPAKMGSTFANNPKLGSAMNPLRPHLTKMLQDLKQSRAYGQLAPVARQIAADIALSGIGSHRAEQKEAFRKQLFPPGVGKLSRESFDGNTSCVSAMVGQEQWHALLLASENRRVTQTDWKPNEHGHLTCKTWEPGQQKTWNWTRNKAGDMIAMDQGKPLQGGGSLRTAYFYPADGGAVIKKMAHTDASGKTTFGNPPADAARAEAKHTGVNKTRASESGFIVEEVDDDVQTVPTIRKQIAAAPEASSQALVRRPSGDEKRT